MTQDPYEDEPEKKKIVAIKMVANVPLGDAELMVDWNKSCQAKVPIGHGDYRWGKMLSDHLYVKNFKDLLEKIDVKLDKLVEQKEKSNDDLFK